MKSRVVLFIFMGFLLFSSCQVNTDAYKDTRAPILTVLSPTNTEDLGEKFLISLYVDEPDCQAWLSVDGGTNILLGSLSGTNTFQFILPGLGSRQLSIYAEDAAGNRSDLKTVTINRVAIPWLYIFAPNNNAVTALNNMQISVDVGIEAPYLITNISFSSNGAAFQNTFQIGPTVSFNFTNLKEGLNTIVFRAYGNNGRYEDSEIWQIYKDTLAPTLSVTEPSDITNVTEDSFNITGSVWDSGAAGLLGVWRTIGTNTDRVYISSDNPWTNQFTLKPGRNVLNYFANDMVGNVSVTNTVAIYQRHLASDAATNDRYGYAVAISSNVQWLAVSAPNANGGIGKIYMVEKNGSTWVERAILSGSDSSAGDHFGETFTMSADGTFIVVGVTNKNKVYVFERVGTSWASSVETAVLSDSALSGGENFGKSVAVNADGSVIAVGIPKMNLTNTESGGVEIFERSGAAWVTINAPTYQFNAADTGASDHFGFSLSLSADGKALVVGAPGQNGNNGTAYVFTNMSPGWSSGTKLLPVGTQTNDRVGGGALISPNGQYAFIGAPGYNGSIGAVYVYLKSVTNWAGATLVAKLTMLDGNPGDLFGKNMSCDWSGLTLAVGVPLKLINSYTNQGGIYLFSATGSWEDKSIPLSQWDHAGLAFDHFGRAVAVDANSSILYVGIPDSSRDLLPNQGSVYHYYNW